MTDAPIPELDDDTDPLDYPVSWGGQGYTLDAYKSSVHTIWSLVARIIILNDHRTYAVGWHIGGDLPWIEGPTFDEWAGNAKSQAMRAVCDAVRCARAGDHLDEEQDDTGRTTCDNCGAVWYPNRRHRTWRGITPTDLMGGYGPHNLGGQHV